MRRAFAGGFAAGVMVAAGTPGTTVLNFPDNTVTFAWLGGNKATATFAGMVPQPITFSTADATTRFTFEDRVYFFVSDRAAAAAAAHR